MSLVTITDSRQASRSRLMLHLLKESNLAKPKHRKLKESREVMEMEVDHGSLAGLRQRRPKQVTIKQLWALTRLNEKVEATLQ
jgi:hypothetical protein